MSIEYAQGWDDAKAQITTDNSATLIEALNMVADQAKEISNLKAALRVAASALIDAGMYARKYGDELLNVREALATIKEAL